VDSGRSVLPEMGGQVRGGRPSFMIISKGNHLERRAAAAGETTYALAVMNEETSRLNSSACSICAQ